MTRVFIGVVMFFSQKGMDELKKLGVKTVFSVTPTDKERAFALKSGITLVETPFDKTGVPQDKLRVYLKQLKAAEQPFYVHCHSGKKPGRNLTRSLSRTHSRLAL